MAISVKTDQAVTAYWDKVHKQYTRESVVYDNWLDRFEGTIASCQTPIIDLGCGSGNDTKYLLEKGKTVVSSDRSVRAVENIRKNFPEVQEACCFDMTQGLPFADEYCHLLLADLSLHYFSETETFAVLRELKRVLQPDGILLLRVNSVNDINHGAGQGEEVEHHYYKTEDKGFKRFFDREDLNRFFFDWEELYVCEESMLRYELPKMLWVCAYRVRK